VAVLYVTGFEHGAFSVSGGGIANATTNAALNSDGAYVRTGSYSMRLYRSGTAAAGYMRLANWGGTYRTLRFYVYFLTMPDGNFDLCYNITAASTAHRIYVDSSGYCWAKSGTSSAVGGSFQMVAETWYRVDVTINVSANPQLMDWAINGIAQDQASVANNSSTLSYTYIGTYNAVAHYEAYYDDIAITSLGSDYPIGEGKVVALWPNADGTHNNSSGYLTNAAGGVIDGSSVYAYAQMNNPLTGSAKYVKQIDIAASEYVTINFDDWNVANGTPRYVYGYEAYKSASTVANDGKAYFEADSEIEIFAGDMSQSTVYYQSVAPVISGALTTTKLNAISARMGYSEDATPNPYWTGFCLEVDCYTPSAVQHNVVIAMTGY